MRAHATLLACGAAAALAAAPRPVRAAPIAFGEWYSFGTFGAGSIAEGCAVPFPSRCGEVYYNGFSRRAIEGPAAPWTFTATEAVTVTIQDLFDSGDRYSLFAGAALVGSTSPTARGQTCRRGGPEAPFVILDDCLPLPLLSRGTFALGPGSYALTIRADEVSTNLGVAAFRVDAASSTVPEPSTLALGAAGALLVGAVARRRRA